MILGLVSMGCVAAAATTDLTGVTDTSDRVDDVQALATDGLARGDDENRFGNPEFRPGLSGSLSLSYAGQTGNSESQEFAAGARLRYASGQFVQTIGFALDFADTAGVRTKEDVFGIYDGLYYFDEKFYGFVMGRIESDALAVTADDIATDAFIGFGPGYRIINTEKMTLRVQAGIGASYLRDGEGGTTRGTGYILSSRFFYAFSDTIFATNDTDVLKTASALRLDNDFGINFKISDAMSTRVSYLTNYNDSRAIRADNRIGVALVVGF